MFLDYIRWLVPGGPYLNVSVIGLMSVVLMWECGRKAMETRGC